MILVANKLRKRDKIRKIRTEWTDTTITFSSLQRHFIMTGSREDPMKRSHNPPHPSSPHRSSSPLDFGTEWKHFGALVYAESVAAIKKRCPTPPRICECVSLCVKGGGDGEQEAPSPT